MTMRVKHHNKNPAHGCHDPVPQSGRVAKSKRLLAASDGLLSALWLESIWLLKIRRTAVNDSMWHHLLSVARIVGQTPSAARVRFGRPVVVPCRAAVGQLHLLALP